MYQVYNWQLGRTMLYKYPAVPPERQAAWVFDTNKCTACQTCTIACKNAWTSGKGQEYMFWNNVESKPWGFYPMGWDVRLLDALGPQHWENGVYRGKTIFETDQFAEEVLGILPEKEDWSHPNLGEDEVNQQLADGQFLRIPHQPWMFYLARICNHCTYPACLFACPRRAIYKRKEDGIVLLDQQRCRGYQECVRACPYKKSMFRPLTGKSEKCIACFPAVEMGFQPQCVQNCIGKIRLFGFKNRYDRPDPDNPIDYLVHVLKIALPLYPQFGTEPNVYYIPPIHVPLPFLIQMFGPGAQRAVELYRRATEDVKLVGLLTLFGSTPQIVHKFKVQGDLKRGTATAYDAKGAEIVSVPITEPTVVRKAYDAERQVYRFSVT